eukprot:scaffold32899_cov68-Phaeocystis_antarctica.AAC.3
MISVHYCRQMLAGALDDDTKASFDFTFAVILPGGAWCLITDLDQATIDDADKLSHGEALTALVAGEFDVCVPHMFCWPGYTSMLEAPSWLCHSSRYPDLLGLTLMIRWPGRHHRTLSPSLTPTPNPTDPGPDPNQVHGVPLAFRPAGRAARALPRLHTARPDC